MRRGDDRRDIEWSAGVSPAVAGRLGRRLVVERDARQLRTGRPRSDASRQCTRDRRQRRQARRNRNAFRTRQRIELRVIDQTEEPVRIVADVEPVRALFDDRADASPVERLKRSGRAEHCECAVRESRDRIGIAHVGAGRAARGDHLRAAQLTREEATEHAACAEDDYAHVFVPSAVEGSWTAPLRKRRSRESSPLRRISHALSTANAAQAGVPVLHARCAYALHAQRVAQTLLSVHERCEKRQLRRGAVTDASTSLGMNS